MGFVENFYKKVTDLKQQISFLLDKKELIEQKELSYEVQTDLSQIHDLRFGLPLTYPKRIDILFTKLSPYFEGGVLFYKNNSTWTPTRAFFMGRPIPLTNAEKKMQFDFPAITLTEIKKASNQKVLMDLGIDLQASKLDAFLIHPHPDYMLLILSSLADPWRKLHIEKIQTQILMAVSDII